MSLPPYAAVTTAIGTREPLAIGGAGLFYASDALIAWERFVKAQPWHRLAIIVTLYRRRHSADVDDASVLKW